MPGEPAEKVVFTGEGGPDGEIESVMPGEPAKKVVLTGEGGSVILTKPDGTVLSVEVMSVNGVSSP